jgi:hypothetical protein
MPGEMVTVGFAMTMVAVIRKAIEDKRLKAMAFVVEFCLRCLDPRDSVHNKRR